MFLLDYLLNILLYIFLHEKNDDNNSYVIIVDLYDNIEGKPLDYVKKTDEADSSVANGFDNTLLLPIYYPAANAPNNDTSAKPHIDELQNMRHITQN